MHLSRTPEGSSGQDNHPVRSKYRQSGGKSEPRTSWQRPAGKTSAVLVDFHGTLCKDNYWSSLPEPFCSSVQEALFSKNPEMVISWMRGELASEDVCSFLSSKLSIKYDDLWRGLQTSCRRMKISRTLLRELQALRHECVVALVTSNMDCFSRFVVRYKKLDEKFDMIVNSADYGQLKEDNDGEIFYDVADRIGVPVSRMSLMDDSPIVCRIFHALGGNACYIENGLLEKHDVWHAFQTEFLKTYLKADDGDVKSGQRG